jgi:hypothetical protein
VRRGARPGGRPVLCPLAGRGGGGCHGYPDRLSRAAPLAGRVVLSTTFDTAAEIRVGWGELTAVMPMHFAAGSHDDHARQD